MEKCANEFGRDIITNQTKSVDVSDDHPSFSLLEMDKHGTRTRITITTKQTLTWISMRTIMITKAKFKSDY